VPRRQCCPVTWGGAPEPACGSCLGAVEHLTDATGADLVEAAAAAALIEERGFNRGQSLSEDLAAIIGQARKK
jgi:hypothetical protein